MIKILAIDDQKDNLTTIKAVIKSNIPECEVLLALSGEEGIELARKEQPDTILLDIIMPGLDGYEVCKRLKADAETNHIPVILITAIKTDATSRIKGLNLGAEAFLSKPIDPYELSAQVNVMLRIKKAEDKLRKEKQNLEKQIALRTHEIAIKNEGLQKEISERKSAQEEIGKISKHFQSIIEKAPDGIILLDEKANFKYISPSAKRIFGYNASEKIEGDPGRFCHPEDLPVVLEHLAKLNENKNYIPTLQFRFSDAKGNWKWIEATLSNLLSDINVGAIVINFHDITNQKVATQALLESEQKLRLMIENSPVGVSTTDLHGIFVSVNPTLCNIIGYKKEEMLGKHFNTFSNEEDAEKNSLLFDQLVNEEISFFDLEKRYNHKNGKIVNVFIRAQLIRNEIGQPLYQTAIIEDITERKRAEQIQKVLYNISQATLVSKSTEELVNVIQQQLGTVVNTKNFYIAFYDDKTNTFSSPFVSDEKDDLTTWPAGKSVSFWVVESGKSLLVKTKEMMQMKQRGEVEFIGVPSKCWLGVPLSIHGKTNGVLALQSYTDENAFSKYDQELLEFVATQISTSLERKKADENLIKALIKANESDRLKSAFLATMSHELRTPLNAIIGFSEFLNDDDLPSDDVKKFGEIIHSSGNHLLSIVNDLFDITLIETGETIIRKDQISLSSLIYDVKSIIDAKRQRDDKSHIDFNLNLSKQLDNIQIIVDSNKLKQILLNLLKNAFKFTEKGNVILGVELESSQSDLFLKFYIKDSGIGIAESKHKIIFEIFRQVEDTTVRKFGGTGIGLSVAKRLTELLGGKIWIESKEGAGSTFYVTIPFEKTEIENIVVEKNRFDKIENKGDSILIAEDDEASFFFMKVILDKLGLDVIWAKNGEEAIRFCRENNQIRIVLMDINMPIVDGYQATKQIKEFRPALPVIAQTAYAVAGDREKTLLAGCDDYISKPIDREMLIGKIQALLANK